MPSISTISPWPNGIVPRDAIFNFLTTLRSRGRRNQATTIPARRWLHTVWRSFKSLSLIERAFPVRCLGNNILEPVPRGEHEAETLRHQFIAKKHHEHHTSSPN